MKPKYFVFLVLLFLLSISSAADAKPLTSKQIAKKYDAFLQKKSVRFTDPVTKERFSLTLKNCYFTVLDINGDDIPELILDLCSGGIMDLDLHVFRIRKNKVAYVGTIQNQKDADGVWYSPKYHAILSIDFGNFRNYNYFLLPDYPDKDYNRVFTLYRMKNGKFKIYRSAGFYSDGECYFRKNDTVKPISFEKYLTYSNRYHLSAHAVAQYPNTKQNRGQHLYSYSQFSTSVWAARYHTMRQSLDRANFPSIGQ